MFELNAPLLWVIAGLVLLCIELVGVPGFMVGSAGIAALFAAIVALFAPVAVQWVVWALVTVKLITYARRFVPKETTDIKESTEARSLKEIPAGQKGRVRYAGSIWDAKCGIEGMSIPAGEDLYVMERRGNLLIVIPDRLASGRDISEPPPASTSPGNPGPA